MMRERSERPGATDAPSTTLLVIHVPGMCADFLTRCSSLLHTPNSDGTCINKMPSLPSCPFQYSCLVLVMPS